MSIVTILMVIWLFNRSKKLKETKDIEMYVLTYPTKIKDRDGYINFYSKIYFRSGISLIIFEIFCILNKYYFDLSIKVLSVLFCVLFILICIQSIIICKTSKHFTS